MYNNLKEYINFGMRNIIDSVLPPRCPITGEIVNDNGMLSPDAWKGLVFLSDPQCACCGYPFAISGDISLDGQYCGSCLSDMPHFDTARAPVAYNDASRDIILGFKHGDQLHVIKTIAALMRRVLANPSSHADVFMPVPLHRWRLLKRRYNQSSVIGRDLAMSCKKTFLPDGLLRVRATPPQKDKSRDLRRKNVRAAFSVNPAYLEHIKGASVILVDDVYTTGATVNECARVLKSAGAKAVDVLTFARVAKDVV